MYDTDYDHIWRNAFLRATPVVFNMVCVLLIGLAPLYLILRTRQEMTQILTTSTTDIMPTSTELLHYRLQAILRDYNMPDLEYIGERPSYKTGDNVPWYRIGKAEVPIDAITELDTEEDEDESDSL